MPKYISKNKSTLYRRDNPSKSLIELLWGDTVIVLNDTPVEGKVKVRSRGREGYVAKEDLMDKPLLELYFIDVGQGDGILIVTPERKHVLIDGGYNRKKQPHGKNAADFVDWKFFKDYRLGEIELDVMICSHCDADHYGGLWDLVNPSEKNGLDTTKTIIHQFCHAGISWWEKKVGTKKVRFLGDSVDGFLVDLIGNKASIKRALKPSDKNLQGEWAQFLKCITDNCNDIRRVGYNPQRKFEYIDGFGPDDDGVQLKVLGPIYELDGSKPKVKNLGNESKNTNGNSIMLRVDYGRSRILLTGDLNKNSQRYILETFKGNRQELAADVIKACHHGSDDCSFEFLECVQASATIISSGDDETHAHPRPNIVAASGVSGFRTVEKDELVTPLIYSTEISRSFRIGDPKGVNINGTDQDLAAVNIAYERTASGALRPEKKIQKLNQLRIVDGIVYGLVNVRTDGEKIICATLNEGKHKWEIKEFYSRF